MLTLNLSESVYLSALRCTREEECGAMAHTTSPQHTNPFIFNSIWPDSSIHNLSEVCSAITPGNR